MEVLLKPKDVQEILGLKHSIVYRLLSAGEIPSIMVTNGQRKRSFRVRPSCLEKWMKAREVKNEK